MAKFREQLAALRGRPVVRPSRKRQKRSWNRDYRLRVALSNNNRGTWWVCIADSSVAEIERRFIEGNVGGNLLEVTGGILGDHKVLKHTARQHYLYVQLSRRDEFIDVSLADLGIKPGWRIPFSQIRHF